MDSSVGARRLKERFRATANDIANHSQALRRHVVRAESIAGDIAVKVQDEARLYEFLSTILNDLISFSQQFDVLRSRTVEGAEASVDIQIDAARNEKDFAALRGNYSTTATMAMALLSSEYVSSLIASDEQLSSQMLRMIGLERVKEWVDAGGDTKDLENE